jgi:hypothetical protein
MNYREMKENGAFVVTGEKRGILVLDNVKVVEYKGDIFFPMNKIAGCMTVRQFAEETYNFVQESHATCFVTRKGSGNKLNVFQVFSRLLNDMPVVMLVQRIKTGKLMTLRKAVNRLENLQNRLQPDV